MTARTASTLLTCLLVLTLLGGCAQRLAAPGPYAEGDGPGPAVSSASFHTEDGLRLPLRHWLPEGEPRAVVLALHGMNDYSRAFDLPGEAFAGAGVATYAYDQRGFGEAPSTGLWAGSGTYADDLLDAAGALAERHPGVPLFLLGDSFGGAVTVTALSRQWPEEVAGAILVAPAVRDRQALGFIPSVSLWLAYLVAPGWTPSGAELEIQATDNIPLLRSFSRDPLVIKGTRIDTVYGLVGLMDQAQDRASALSGGPVLLLYGEKDEVIPREAIDRFWENLEKANPEALRLDFGSGWHWLLRDLHRQEVFGAMLGWMERRGVRPMAPAAPTSKIPRQPLRPLAKP